jgi:hypothetical protein
VNEKLKEVVTVVAKEEKYQQDEAFILKVLQFQELLDVRHSVMLLGPTGCGKCSSHIRSHILPTACTTLFNDYSRTLLSFRQDEHMEDFSEYSQLGHGENAVQAEKDLCL